jgi:hypothetical protein
MQPEKVEARNGGRPSLVEGVLSGLSERAAPAPKKLRVVDGGSAT